MFAPKGAFNKEENLYGLRIAAQVGTPLALAGLVIALFFYLLRQIIAPKFLPKLTREQAATVFRWIIASFFILALVAAALGFAGWLVQNQNHGVPFDRYEALVASGAVNDAALDNFFQQIGETNPPRGNVSERLQHAVQRYSNLENELRTTNATNANRAAEIREGIQALREGDLKKAAKLLKLQPPPVTNLRVFPIDQAPH